MLTPWHETFDCRFYVGHVLDVLRPLPERSVHMCVTSPPYYSLRDYGLPPVVWGGDPGCEHEWQEHRRCDTYKGGGPGFNRDRDSDFRAGGFRSHFCAHCDAWRGCLGLEPLPDCLSWARGEPPCPICFICHMRMIFAEVYRVLRDDGTCWINIGDSYAGSGNGWQKESGSSLPRRWLNEYGTERPPGYLSSRHQVNGLKPKDLMLIPSRLALALQTDGWFVRMDCVWEKPAPMPESINDRPTRSHEYVWLLAKSKRYYYDQDALREPVQESTIERYKHKWNGNEYRDNPSNHHNNFSRFMGSEQAMENAARGRNARSVWRMTSEPTGYEHFATFPTELPRRCILAGTSEAGACPKCGAPYTRQTEKTPIPDHVKAQFEAARKRTADEHGRSDGFTTRKPNFKRETKTTGWRPSCKCNAGDPVPCVVLDPFGGTGRTNIVARQLGRHSIYIDQSEKYAKFARQSLDGQTPMLPMVLAE